MIRGEVGILCPPSSTVFIGPYVCYRISLDPTCLLAVKAHAADMAAEPSAISGTRLNTPKSHFCDQHA